MINRRFKRQIFICLVWYTTVDMVASAGDLQEKGRTKGRMRNGGKVQWTRGLVCTHLRRYYTSAFQLLIFWKKSTLVINLEGHEKGGKDPNSRFWDIPTSRHFLKRQLLHMLRLEGVMRQVWLPRHCGMLFEWTVRRKKPYENKKIHTSNTWAIVSDSRVLS